MRYSSLICLLVVIVVFRRIDDCIFDALLVLVHLGIFNWLVVFSPKTMEQRIILDLHHVLTVILKYRRI